MLLTLTYLGWKTGIIFEVFKGGVAQASNNEEHRSQQERLEALASVRLHLDPRMRTCALTTGIKQPLGRQAEEALNVRRMENWTYAVLPAFPASLVRCRNQKQFLTIAVMWLKTRLLMRYCLPKRVMGLFSGYI